MEDLSIHPVNTNVHLPAQKVATSQPMVNEQPEEEGKDAPNVAKDVAKKEENVLDLSETVERVKQFVKTVTTKLTFDVNPDTNDSVIYVKDKDSGRVIRQIPPEDMLKLIAKMDDITGMLFNGRA